MVNAPPACARAVLVGAGFTPAAAQLLFTNPRETGTFIFVRPRQRRSIMSAEKDLTVISVLAVA